MSTYDAAVTHTRHAVPLMNRGRIVPAIDEPCAFDRFGEPEGWSLFVQFANGEHATAEELREIADAMESYAREREREGETRNDV